MRTTKSSTSRLVWSVLTCLLVTLASVLGLIDPRIYAQETANWALQAQGQDIGNLVAVVALLVSALRLHSGSVRAGAVWLGTLLYLIYAYIVYAMAVHLNVLFLVYVAVLGSCSYLVMFSLAELRTVKVDHPAGAARSFGSWTLVATGVLFALLWLSELIPALLTGTVPASLQQAGLVVNPIHVIDLAVVLPAFIITGLAARSGRDFGLFWLAPWLTFSVLMATSIVAAMLLMLGSGFPDAVAPLVMVAVVLSVSAVALWRYLRGLRPAPPAGIGAATDGSPRR